MIVFQKNWLINNNQDLNLNYDARISEAEIQEDLRKIKIVTAPGVDKILVRVLKNTYIFKIVDGYIPKVMKKARAVWMEMIKKSSTWDQYLFALLWEEWSKIIRK